MNRFPMILKAILLFGIGFVVLATTALLDRRGSAQTPTSAGPINYDIRQDPVTLRTVLPKTDSSEFTRRQERARVAELRLRERTSDLNVERGSMSGDLSIVGVGPDTKTGFLTPPTANSRSEVLADFLQVNRGLFGIDDISELKETADYLNPAGNIAYRTLAQHINGIPVFQAELRAVFSRRNELVRIVSDIVAVPEDPPPADFGEPGSAIRIANQVTGLANLSSVRPERTYFPLATGIVAAAWIVVLEDRGRDYLAVVGVAPGRLFWLKSLTEDQTQTATFEVYGSSTSPIRSADSPSPGTPGCNDPTACPEPSPIHRQLFTLIGNEAPYTFNNTGWIPDGETRTIGNNVEAGIDRDSIQGIDPDGWAFGGSGRSFVFAYNPAPGIPAPGENPVPASQTYPPSAFQQGSVTHAFYVANRWHDEAYALGFTEAARNFQTDNFSRGGIGGDSLSVEVQEGTGTNGASFTTGPDGQRPRAQYYVWTGPDPDRDGALDSQVVVHELTHGMSNRLVGNATGLTGNMARGMGEGWSDFFALAMLSEPTDDQCGINAVGGYVTRQIISGFEANYYYGIRRFPVARRACLGPNGKPHNPLTFRYVNSDCNTLIGTTTSNPPPNSAFPRGPIGVTTCDQIHNLGEFWSAVLWEVRGQLIDIHGAADGNRRAMQYVTDGMKISPINPTMLQARDAIVTAANVSDPTDLVPVSRGFALRGMGLSASIQNTGTGSNNTIVTESFDGAQIASTRVRADFDGDGRSDISVFRPSEGVWYENRSAAGFTALNWGLAGDQLTPGDFDGDGKSDIAVFRAAADPSLPDFYVLRSADSSYAGFSWGLPGDVPVVADYDGDDKSDIAVFRPSSHTYYVRRSSTGDVLTYSGIVFGVPVAGDFDGDGKADFASYSINGWFLSQSNINYASVTFVRFGTSGDRPVPGDYDGDARDDFAVFRPSDRTWYIRRSSGGVSYAEFGIPTDEPVPADYDGDGRTDVAVFRNGDWYVDRSTGGFLTMHFGLAGDVPVQKAYLP